MSRLLKAAYALAIVSFLSTQTALSSGAATYNGSVNKTDHTKTTTTVKSGTYWQRHPKAKAAAKGAAVGTAAGAVTGLITHKGVVRGAAIGAGTGAGVGLIRSSSTMRAHPIAKNAATGAAVGLGLGLAGGHGRHDGLKGAAVGGAIGLGYGVIKDGLR
jgi:hypothetical protein